MAENECAPDYDCREYFKEAVCIDAQRVYDSCSDKDCIEDIRVLFPAARQPLVDSATNVRVRDVNVITVYIDLQPIPFNKGFYSVDMTFFFNVCLDLFGGTASCPVPVDGVAIFNKKVVLYGSEGNVKLFTSGCSMEDLQAEDARVLPKATVQVAQPVALSARLCEQNACGCEPYCRIPECICQRWGLRRLSPEERGVCHHWSVHHCADRAECADADSCLRLLRTGEGMCGFQRQSL